MKSFEQKFTIHPIGQGLFYSGLIKINNTIRFKMVFDCGSLTKGAADDEIKLFRDYNFKNDNILDLLIISHFDADHVNKLKELLDGSIKIKRLVMPFLTFTDRLFLVLKYGSTNRGFGSADDFILNIILDPIGTLRDNLDDDSQIYLIDSDPDNPIAPSEEENPDESSLKEQENLEFDFEKKDLLKTSELTLLNTLAFSNLNLYKVLDRNKGFVKSLANIKLMEFLFYRRSISEDEAEFYKIVERLFYDKYRIDPTLDGELKTTSIIEVIKRKIKAAKPLKEIFREARRVLKIKDKSDLEVEDLNTTALCLLHRNLSPLKNGYGIIRNSSIQINRFISDDPARLETKVSHRFYMRYRNSVWEEHPYPDTLLTSDSFLLTENQVSEFLRKYKNYWGQFHFFQIPHHGSDRNADQLILSQVPEHVHCFINYGVGNRHKHPSSGLINNIVSTGHSSQMISINQYLGIRFQYSGHK